jgi:hypothetical protein
MASFWNIVLKSYGEQNAPLYIVSLYTVIFGNLTPKKKERPHLTAKNLASLSNKSKLTDK